MTATDKTSCIAHRQNIRFFVMFSDFLEVASVSKEHQHKLAAFWRVLETKTNERILSNDDKKIPNTPEHLWIEIPYSEFVSRSLRIYKASAFQIAAAESERLGFSKSRVLKRPTNKDNPDSPLEDYKEYYFCTEVMQSVINGGAYPTPIENNSTLLKSIAIRKGRKAVEKNTTGIENNRGNAIESNRDGIENNKKKYSKESNKKNKEVEESVSVATTATPSSDDEDAHTRLSSLSSQPERSSDHATHSPPASPAAALVAAALVRSGDAAGSQTNQQGMDRSSLIVTGQGDPHPEPGKEKALRKPRAKPDELLKVRIERVYTYFDALGQEVTEGKFRYHRTKRETAAIKEWLTSHADDEVKPSEATLRAVYIHLWKKPKDPRSDFRWQDNMTIHAVLNNYDATMLALKAKQKPPSKERNLDETCQLLGFSKVVEEPEIPVAEPTPELLRAMRRRA